MDLVSVVVPAYNAEKYINECIHSLLGQTYQDIEIIIVDDGSTDRTAEICIQLAEQDNRIRYHRQNNSGVSVARNTGHSISHGQYILFIDADDELHPSMIERLVFDIKQNDADISVCDIKKISSPDEKTEIDETETVDLYMQDEALNLYMSFNYFEIGVWNKLFKSSLIENIAFPEGRKMNEDKYFIFESLMKANKVCYRKEPLYYYYVRPDSATKRGFDDRWFDNRYFAQKIYSVISEKKKNLEEAARTQYVLTLYYLILVMKRNSAQIEYSKEYKSIVSEIKKISIKKLPINKKTKVGIFLLQKCEKIFDFLQSK